MSKRKEEFRKYARDGQTFPFKVKLTNGSK